MEYTEKVIEGSESFRDVKGGGGFKEICLLQVSRVVANGSKEWKEGFWIYNTPPIGQTSQPVRYVGDSREEYMHSIEVLHDLLLPKFEKENKDMKEQAEAFEKALKDLPEKYKKRIKAGEDRKKTSNFLWTEQLALYRNLFQHLICFLESIGWLESQELSD